MNEWLIDKDTAYIQCPNVIYMSLLTVTYFITYIIRVKFKIFNNNQYSMGTNQQERTSPKAESGRSWQGSGRVPGRTKMAREAGALKKLRHALCQPCSPVQSFLSTSVASPPLSLTRQQIPFVHTEHQAAGRSPWPHGTVRTLRRRRLRQRFRGLPRPWTKPAEVSSLLASQNAFA